MTRSLFSISKQKEMFFMNKQRLLLALMLFCMLGFTPAVNSQQLNGLVKDYYPTGELMTELNYKNGILDGVAKGYYPNGQVRYSATYVNGKENGTRQAWTQEGVLISEMNFKDNIANGVSKLFDDTGALLSELNFKEGKLLNAEGQLYTGEFEIKYKDGKPREKNTYVDGVLNGLSEVYDADGTLIIQETYKNGLRDGKSMEIIDDDPTPKCEFNYKMGVKEGEAKCYFPNGKVARETYFINGVPNGPSKEYYESGLLLMEYTMENGVLKGAVKKYYEDGKLMSEENY